MTKYSFGPPVDDDDVLEVQGIEYPMNPIGMRAMRKLLTLQKTISRDRADDDPVTEEDLDLALEIVIGAVRPDFRDRFREHIEDSVPPPLLIQIAHAVMGAFSDLDPTQPGLSPDGSSTTGPGSTAGALDVVSTPVI